MTSIQDNKPIKPPKELEEAQAQTQWAWSSADFKPLELQDGDDNNEINSLENMFTYIDAFAKSHSGVSNTEIFSISDFAWNAFDSNGLDASDFDNILTQLRVAVDLPFGTPLPPPQMPPPPPPPPPPTPTPPPVFEFNFKKNRSDFDKLDTYGGATDDDKVTRTQIHAYIDEFASKNSATITEQEKQDLKKTAEKYLKNNDISFDEFRKLVRQMKKML